MAANTDTLGSGPQIVKDDDKQLAACRKMRNWLLDELVECRNEKEQLRELVRRARHDIGEFGYPDEYPLVADMDAALEGKEYSGEQ